MTKRLAVALLAPLVLLTLGAKSKGKEKAEKAPAKPAVISMNGFEIAPLEVGAFDGPVVQTLSMFLPASAGFAPNVSVQIQTYGGTMDEFVALSRSQFAQFGANVLSYEKVGPNAMRGEYTSQMQGQSLHFYLRSVHVNGRVFLATATATEAQWKLHGETLKANVDSFNVPAS